jgi:hypothetical protein
LSSSPDETSRCALPFEEKARVGIAADPDTEEKPKPLLLCHSIRGSIYIPNPQLYAILAFLKMWIK